MTVVPYLPPLDTFQVGVNRGSPHFPTIGHGGEPGCEPWWEQQQQQRWQAREFRTKNAGQGEGRVAEQAEERSWAKGGGCADGGRHYRGSP